MKKNLKRLVAVTSALAMLPVTAFAGQWYDSAVNYCKEKNIIAKNYNVEGMLTRGEMANILCNAADPAEVVYSESPFADVDVNDANADCLIRLYNAKIFMGSQEADGSVKANVNDNLTREQAAAFIVRAYDFDNKGKALEFKDKNTISDYAVKDISVLTEKGIISGYEDNTFRPKKNVSKAEFLMMIYKTENPSKDKEEPKKEEIKNQAEVGTNTNENGFTTDIKVEVLNKERITVDTPLRIRFSRFRENTGEMYVYNHYDFQLERKTADGWVRVLPDKGAHDDIGYTIAAGTSIDKNVNLGYFFSNLKDGEYRLVYDFHARGIGTGSKVKQAAAYFTIDNNTDKPAENKGREDLKKYIGDYVWGLAKKTFSPHYELISYNIEDYFEATDKNSAATTFDFVIRYKNYDKDPDTVPYIKEAKEKGDPNYQVYYDEYLQEKDMVLASMKALVDENGGIKLFYDEDPTGNIKWVPFNMDDCVLR